MTKKYDKLDEGMISDNSFFFNIDLNLQLIRAGYHAKLSPACPNWWMSEVSVQARPQAIFFCSISSVGRASVL